MKINLNAEAVFTFLSAEYNLNQSSNGDYYLFRKGGLPVIYLTNSEAEQLKKAGFTSIEY